MPHNLKKKKKFTLIQNTLKYKIHKMEVQLSTRPTPALSQTCHTMSKQTREYTKYPQMHQHKLSVIIFEIGKQHHNSHRQARFTPQSYAILMHCRCKIKAHNLHLTQRTWSSPLSTIPCMQHQNKEKRKL